MSTLDHLFDGRLNGKIDTVYFQAYYEGNPGVEARQPTSISSKKTKTILKDLEALLKRMKVLNALLVTLNDICLTKEMVERKVT